MLLLLLQKGLSTLVRTVPGSLYDAKEYTAEHGINSKNGVVFGFYCGFMVITVLFAAAVYFRSKIFTQIMIGVTEIVLIVLTVINAVIFYLVVRPLPITYPIFLV